MLEGSGNSESMSVPLVSWVNAGTFQVADQVMRDDDFKTLTIAGLPHGDWIALQVEGDSMDRIFPPHLSFWSIAQRRGLYQMLVT